ncbi:TonB-dependent receptor [Pedobacter gandavensis]|uniref:TonB-dependent siderophore receptor n=1 Tax=Pedobacter gandavensis TaxID=2679963 RepID=A0ABR6F1F9_9SPHI|nr:TonB-dependent receptor [Pedobacter gandavensis]MBB2151370.1 TonB-dependent siderophore receptor [Pedobacter gandavensis]
MRHPYLIILFTLLNLSAFSQQKTLILGQVQNPKGEALEGVTVALVEQKSTTMTDAKGHFQFSTSLKGNLTIKAILIGYDVISRKIDIQTANETSIKLILSPSDETLQTVEITGRKEKNYTNAVSFGGTKTAAAIKDVPQSIQYVTKELMQDQGAVRMTDIVKNVSGVNQYTFYDDVSIRGFRNQGGVGSSNSNQLFNGLRTFNGFWRQNLLNYLERVEIIKGPASALFGNANPGGTINKVTKKPLDTNFRSLNFQRGSFNTWRANADLTGPMNKKKTVLYRLNLGYENAESFRDLLFDKNIVVAPSLSYIPSDRTRINFDLVYNKSNSRLDRGQSIFGSTDLYSTPISLNVADENDYLKEKTYLVTTSLSHKLTDHITFNTSFLRTGYRQDLFEHRSTAFAVDAKGKQIEELAFRRASIRHNEQYSNSFTAYLSSEFKTGPLKHILITGYDYNDSKIPLGSSQNDATGYRLKDGTVTTKYVVKDSAKYEMYAYKGKMIPKPNVPSFDLSKNTHSLLDVSGYIYAPNPTDVVVPSYCQQHSIYVQDQIAIDRFKVLLGLRYDTYLTDVGYKTNEVNRVTQTALLPRIGITYEVTRDINAYATYTTGYNPQTASSQNSLSGGPFDPLKSNLLEAGLKTDWFNKRLSATASIYRIEQRNSLYNALDPNHPELMIQIGKDISKGLEMDIVGYISPNLNVVATYAYIHAVLKGAQGGADSLYNNQQKPNTPKHMGSLWAKYQFSIPGLKGLGLGAGAYYVGKRTFGFQGQQSILPSKGPAYMLLNAALYYKINKLQLQLNMNNLTNKTHWVGGYDSSRLYPGAPRNWLTSVTYAF